MKKIILNRHYDMRLGEGVPALFNKETFEFSKFSKDIEIQGTFSSKDSFTIHLIEFNEEINIPVYFEDKWDISIPLNKNGTRTVKKIITLGDKNEALEKHIVNHLNKVFSYEQQVKNRGERTYPIIEIESIEFVYNKDMFNQTEDSVIGTLNYFGFDSEGVFDESIFEANGSNH